MRLIMITWRERGLAACVRKVLAAIQMTIPVLLWGRRTARGVAAYFDLITDEARLFYGDSFHFGYFCRGTETLDEALDAHTDLVAEMARPCANGRMLDVGCGLGAPAIRIAQRFGCEIVALNISREQVRQGRLLIDERGLASRVTLVRGDARSLPFPDSSFDAVLCLEAAGDICVTEADKHRFVGELHRVLRPGGHVGFSDLALKSCPRAEDDRALRAVLYHAGAELVTDWPHIFARHGFTIVDRRDIIAETLPTWDHTRAVYGDHSVEVVRRYGRRIATRTREQVNLVGEILASHATFPVLSARK